MISTAYRLALDAIINQIQTNSINTYSESDDCLYVILQATLGADSDAPGQLYALADAVDTFVRVRLHALKEHSQ